MSRRKLIKGNEAVIHGALLAGCRAFFGYPITPASEIAESAARLFPPAGAVFLQAESELASINMVFGAASAGVRAMTASSSPGISLMQEGISYLAGAELPCVIVDIMRGGPGLGNIGPEQGDYFQMVKGGGHGCYRNIVLAPASAQEMCDFTMAAFDLADRYRNPAIVLADGTLGQMMEPVTFPAARAVPAPPAWAVCGTAESRANLITSIHLSHDELEAHVLALESKYRQIEAAVQLHENYQTNDAELILVGYGIVARILRSVVDRARVMGMKLGLLRPISLWPFPSIAVRNLANHAKAFLVAELSSGQMVEDVRLALNGACPVHLIWRAGGNLLEEDAILERALALLPTAEESDVESHAYACTR
jgi:pyruvate/2-oxoacid:ferredoxin oxidoreductase alpha subunit